MTLSVQELSEIGMARAARRRRWAVPLVVVIAVAVCTPIVLSGLSELKYRTFAFWAAPNRITYCGRVYNRNPKTVHGTPAHFVWLSRNAPNHWQRIGRTFALRPIYGTVLADPVPGKLCAGSVYFPAGGHDDYVEYSLSGGP